MSKEKQYILALNAGSTSIKSRVFMFNKKGVKEVFSWGKSAIKSKKEHEKAFSDLHAQLNKIGFLGNIIAVGHRVVHGGSLKKSIVIGKKETRAIEKCSGLAPLHNPFNLEGIKKSRQWFGKNVCQVAVFDTAFFSNLPEHASYYALPDKFTKRFNLRRYGFHGISHAYSMHEAAKRLRKPFNKIKVITIHLGGGSSITAIKNGVAVDTSMGFTPLEGLVMGSRSGDVDPGIIFYLGEKAKLSLKQLKNICTQKSGLYGLSGAKNMLELIRRVKRGDKKAKLAFEIYLYRIEKYIGAYLAILGGSDAIVFTGTVGAGDSITRKRVVKDLKSYALKKIPYLTIKPNEEKMIAQEVKDLLGI